MNPHAHNAYFREEDFQEPGAYVAQPAQGAKLPSDPATAHHWLDQAPAPVIFLCHIQQPVLVPDVHAPAADAYANGLWETLHLGLFDYVTKNSALIYLISGRV